MDIPVYTMSAVPYVTTEQMIEVDRSMMEDYRIELIQMMENAGRNLAHLCPERHHSLEPRRSKSMNPLLSSRRYRMFRR
jgi:NAD(P)H-hydrate repair Nnr-like enzyme with NAD(P)H-hydrate epimerase domain